MNLISGVLLTLWVAGWTMACAESRSEGQATVSLANRFTRDRVPGTGGSRHKITQE